MIESDSGVNCQKQHHDCRQHTIEVKRERGWSAAISASDRYLSDDDEDYQLCDDFSANLTIGELSRMVKEKQQHLPQGRNHAGSQRLQGKVSVGTVKKERKNTSPLRPNRP